MKKKYSNLYINVVYLNRNVLFDSTDPFDDGDISIGDMDIDDRFS